MSHTKVRFAAADWNVEKFSLATQDKKNQKSRKISQIWSFFQTLFSP